jgi:flagellar biogenesis protein FliO
VIKAVQDYLVSYYQELASINKIVYLIFAIAMIIVMIWVAYEERRP